MSELAKSLYKGLASRLETYGCMLNLPTETFARVELDGVSHFFQVRCYKSGSGLTVEPAIAVRIDRIEDIFHRTSGFAPEYQRTTPTIGGEVWRLEGQKNGFRYQLRNPKDVPAVTDDLFRLFVEKAVPYFERNARIEAVDVLLNEKPSEKTPHRPMEWLRASTGTIAARLVGRGNFPELVALYRSKVGQLDRGFYLARFEALLEDLVG